MHLEGVQVRSPGAYVINDAGASSIKGLPGLMLRLRAHQGFTQLAANARWMMGEQLIRLLVGVGLSIWMARLLGPEQFGAYSYAISFAATFGVVASLGLNQLLVRELAASRDNRSRIDSLMKTALTMRLGASCLTYVVALTAAWLSGANHLLLVAVVAGSYFFSASDCVELYFQSRAEAGVTARARILSFLVVASLRVALLMGEADVAVFAALVLLEHAAAALVLQLLYRKQGKCFRAAPLDWPLGIRLLRESWPEIAAAFCGLLFVRIDLIMIEHMLGGGATGAYAVAARLSEVWYFVPSVIVASTFPAILAARESDRGVYLKRLQLLMTAMCAASYLVGLGATVLAQPLVAWIFGAAYGDSVAVLIVLIWSGLFVSLAIISGSWMVAEKRIKLNLYRNALGLGANVLLNYWLIPLMGAVGAAWATLVSLCVAYLLFDHFVPSMREISRCKWRAVFLMPAFLRR